MNQLIASSVQKTLALRQSLETLKGKEPPSDSARIFAELLTTLADAILARLIELASKASQAPGTVQPDEVLVLGRAAAQIARFAEPVAQSDTGHVPWGLAFPVEMLCRQISPESRVILYPQWEYNYTYYEALGLLIRMMDGLGKAPSDSLFKGYPKYFAIVSFPAIEQSNTLQHIAWGHEIGHHLNAVFGTTSRVLKNAILDPTDVDQTVAEMLRVGKGSQFLLESQEQLRTRVLAAAVQLTKNWVAELVADIFSIHVFGPASIFAFADIVPVLHPMDEPGRAHPPARLRIWAMMEELDELGYRKLLTEPSETPMEAEVKQAVLAEIARLQDIAGQVSEHPMEPFYRPSMNAARAAIQFIRQEVNRVMAVRGRWTCSADMLRRDVFSLIERLNHDIPPCEVAEVDPLRTRQTHLAAIVNAGWFFHIWRRPQQPPSDENAARRQRAQLDLLNDLILKAIELSEVRRRLRGKDSADATI